MDEPCHHERGDDGVCVRCGDCAHEVILNGACYLCGETELRVTVKDVPADFVPVSRLKRR